MYIAVTTDGDNLESKVSSIFGACQYLLIVDMTDMSLKAIKNEGLSRGETLAQKIVDLDCEAVITGDFAAGEFNILAEDYITRYYGFGYSGNEALELMDKNALEYIKNFGTNDCGGAHHH